MPIRALFVHALVSVLAICVSSSCAVAQPGPGAEDSPYQYFGMIEADGAIESPSEFLGYPLGSRFTRHHLMLDYMEYLASVSDRVRVREYGRTHQDRPLVIVTVSSEENIGDLESIKEANRALADPSTGASRVESIVEENPAIVWLSYNVHGNEPSTMETSMQVAYTVAAGENEELEAIRENVVLVVDPCLNPDGHERYMAFIDNAIGQSPNPDPYSAEHDEPWPGGRTNHYLFDLNRDWVWLVHPESRSRIDVYREYLPHLHIDYHEQGHENPYFFGEGDTPYHANVPEETKRWIKKYGQANAEVFDREGRVFSTAQRFDYLYPGYGKVMPVYHGAVGMLTEKAGHSRGGVEIEVHDRYILTLENRVRDHFLTSMSNIETTSENRQGQLERFRSFFVEALEPSEDAPKAFYVMRSTKPGVLSKMEELCSAHGIEILETTEAGTVDVMSYETGELVEDVAVPAGTWVIETAQPMGRLALTLFERATFIEDPDTYDITSWCVPVMFGADAYYAMREPGMGTRALSWSAGEPAAVEMTEAHPAMVIDSAQHRFPVAVGLASAHDIFGRVSDESFGIGGEEFAKGSLIVHRVRNEMDDLRSFAEDLAAHGLEAHAFTTTMTEEGPVLGADSNAVIETPRIALVRGDDVSSYSFGQHWHLMDVEMPVPHSAVNLDMLRRIDLNTYNTIVIPSAWGLGGGMPESFREELKDWVRSGGAIVASGSSARWVTRHILGVESQDEGSGAESEPEGPYGDESEEGMDRAPHEMTYEERYAKSVEDRVSGAVVRAVVDTSHPLTGGVRKWVGVIKRGADTLDVGENGYVVARYAPAETLVVGGAISDENAGAIAGTPFVTHHRMGRGNVICFNEDITMRGFNHAGMRLLMNAIVLGSSM